MFLWVASESLDIFRTTIKDRVEHTNELLERTPRTERTADAVLHMLRVVSTRHVGRSVGRALSVTGLPNVCGGCRRFEARCRRARQSDKRPQEVVVGIRRMAAERMNDQAIPTASLPPLASLARCCWHRRYYFRAHSSHSPVGTVRRGAAAALTPAEPERFDGEKARRGRGRARK